MIYREKYLSEIRGFYDDDLIKIITGVRRSGKSVVLEQIREELSAKTNNIVSLDFDDRLATDDIETWQFSSRGAGYLFGEKVVDEFNQINNIRLICRAHQLVMEGYKYWFKNKNLLTVWSAPNYCYRCGNEASILILDEKRKKEEFKKIPTHEESSKAPNPKSIVPYFL